METGTIKCGDVFCELCGDCIYCHGDDTCYGDVSGDGEPGYHWYTWPKEEE